MTLRLQVDAARWRAHLRAYGAGEPDVVPVVKGNGYGFGFERLLVEPDPGHWAELAVGTYAEAIAGLGLTSARLVVLNPWRPDDQSAALALGSDRLLHTLSRVGDIAAFARAAAGRDRPARVALEVLSSVRRHGVPVGKLAAAVAKLAAAGTAVTCEALALHHPIARATGSDPVAETVAAVAAARAAGLDDLREVYVSHVSSAELVALRAALGAVRVRPRVGTALWLGDRAAYRPRATVLDVHALRRGERFGYRQRRAPADGWLVVVGGGTTHGIALEAPPAPRGLSARARGLALAGLSASGFALSPFTWAGRKRWFAEPPHMQVSLLFLPSSVPPPAVGDELDVEVRMTTTRFDSVDLA